MDTNISQEINKEDIQYIMFSPYSELYYSYSINSIESQHLIKREDLSIFVEKFIPSFLGRKAEKLYTRFFSFIYIKELQDIQVLESDEIPPDTKELLKEKIIAKSTEKEKKSLYDTLVKMSASLYKKLS